MNLEDFQILDNEPLDNSTIKRDFFYYTIDKEIN